MNSDTVGTQWGQDEKVLLIEPDRGEKTERGGGMMEGETNDGGREGGGGGGESNTRR